VLLKRRYYKDGGPRTGGPHGQGEQHHLHDQPAWGYHCVLESEQPGKRFRCCWSKNGQNWSYIGCN